ncbi:MAG: hypothetical protein HYZ85_01965 [Candidatus Omnitrophica bacterium]|nr:hypothetical protein [Candidatus Omnitrophota bacterium]
MPKTLRPPAFFMSLPEDDAYQTFLEDEFAFEIALASKGHKRLALPALSN